MTHTHNLDISDTSSYAILPHEYLEASGEVQQVRIMVPHMEQQSTSMKLQRMDSFNPRKAVQKITSSSEGVLPPNSLIDCRVSETETGLLPRFPERYEVRHQAYILTLLGSHHYVIPFHGIYPHTHSLAYLSEGDRRIRCPIHSCLRPEAEATVNIKNGLALGEQLALGLKYMHQALPSKPAIIHNWINRYSVFLTEGGVIQIGGFQHALVHEEASQSLPIYPPLPFSPYTAPEVFTSGNCSEKVGRSFPVRSLEEGELITEHTV